MREPNFSFPNQNRAAICISSSIYDRRALDCTDYLPIINTLTNLAYLTGSTPTIREFITRDGGLERLVTILKNTKVNDRKNGLKWTLAFQCVVNIGVRGTEHIRKRVVQAGMVPVIVNVLESFFIVLKSVSEENERQRQRIGAAQQSSQPVVADADSSADPQPFTAPMPDEPGQQQASGRDTNNSSSSLSTSSITAPSMMTSSTSTSIATGPIAPATANLGTEAAIQNAVHYNHSALNNARGPSVMLTVQEPSQNRPILDNARSIPMDAGEARPQQVFYREDDILHSLQLLAYLSKYPSLRSSFHTDSGSNVFAIVEKFTHRSMHPLEIQYWAGVIMRNACRKDDTRKGIRQCAYTGCGKWETKPREFAKCRRCRKAKYCSKDCQSKAWNEGHRWWCIEKRPETMGVSTSFGTDLPPAPPPPPPPPADLQDQQETGPNLMDNGGFSSMASGAGGARLIGGGDGGSSTAHHVRGAQNEQHQHQHRTPSSSSTVPPPQPQSAAGLAPVARAPSSPVQPHAPHQTQQHLLQRQQLSLPQQPQSSRSSCSTSHHQSTPEHLNRDQQSLQHMQLQQQRLQHRYPQAPQQQQQQQQHRVPPSHHAPTSTMSPNHGLQTPQRSMSLPHPLTAPIRLTPRADIMPHLGISPDSPTPEQLAQRFVQQAALHPGQHNELAQHLHAQFQQFFPLHHQAEAKRQFSFHAREAFTRYQRQQEVLRNTGLGSSIYSSNGRSAAGGIHSAPITAPAAAQQSSVHSCSASSSNSGLDTDASKQGTPRRRSDLDSDDEDVTTLQSSPHSTSTSLSVPMLTQDLSTTMSLTSTELSGPLPSSIMDSHLVPDPSLASPSSTAVLNNESEATKAEKAAVRDFKVRKLMSRDESSSHGGSSADDIPGQDPSQREDEWSYSRHMAKDSSMDP